jgi:hypothetical protein
MAGAVLAAFKTKAVTPGVSVVVVTQVLLVRLILAGAGAEAA